jgi:hypothetical protein
MKKRVAVAAILLVGAGAIVWVAWNALSRRAIARQNQAFAQIRVGQSSSEVEEMLGKPARIVDLKIEPMSGPSGDCSQKAAVLWHYSRRKSDALLIFFDDAERVVCTEKAHKPVIWYTEATVPLPPRRVTPVSKGRDAVIASSREATAAPRLPPA